MPPIGCIQQIDGSSHFGFVSRDADMKECIQIPGKTEEAKQLIAEGKTVLVVMVVDAAGEYSMYASDVTRTIPVSGHFTPRQREIYNIVLGAQQAAIVSFVAGKSNMKSRSTNDSSSLDYVAWQYVNVHGKDLHGEPLDKYFIHGVGHSVGIDVHDPYGGNKPWGPGSVFTIESGIYIPEERIGVRIEDTFYVDANGKLIALSGALPKSADAIEALVQKGQASRQKNHASGFRP